MIDEKIKDFIDCGSEFYQLNGKLYILPPYDTPLNNFKLIYLATDLILDSQDMKSILVSSRFNLKLITLPPIKEIILHHLINDINTLT